MSIKSKVFAATAALTLVGGAAAMGATAASAATPSCGQGGSQVCINFFSRDFGTHHNPQFLLDVLRQGEKVGQPIILFQQSNNDPAEDFTISNQGLVSDFATALLVSPAVALHYGGAGHYPAVNGVCALGGAPTAGICTYPDLWAYEIQYSPFGVDSGLCVGVGATAAAGTKVALEPCGVSAKTIWIEDWSNAAGIRNNYVPLINGSDTNFSRPFVLTYPANSYPTDKPRAQIVTENLTGFSNPGHFNPTGVNSNQLWGFNTGPNS
jgi:hypothetical protein